MKRWMAWLAVLAAFTVIGFLPGCGDDDDNGGTTPTQTEFEVLTTYMETNDLDLPTMLTGWTITAQDLFDADPATFFIIDLRTGDMHGVGTFAEGNGTTDFEDGHIPGAHMVSLANVLTYEAANNTENLPVVVVCYTGHSAGHAVMALRLSGVADARVLAWGMSSWHSDFDMWSTRIGNVAYDYDACWVEGPTVPPALPSFESVPDLDTGESGGAAILAHRLETAVLDGLNGITNTAVLEACGDYQVFCYWTLANWELYGNIVGAYQLTPGGLTLETLGMLDPEKTIVFYCWSGQTASMIAAWLNVLGYDGRTLSFSANGMIHDDLQEFKWGEGTLVPRDLDYDTGP